MFGEGEGDDSKSLLTLFVEFFNYLHVVYYRLSCNFKRNAFMVADVFLSFLRIPRELESVELIQNILSHKVHTCIYIVNVYLKKVLSRASIRRSFRLPRTLLPRLLPGHGLLEPVRELADSIRAG